MSNGYDNMRKGPWPGKEGVIPEPESNYADANFWARKYFDEILIEERIIDSHEPTLSTTLFGKEFSSPIVMPAFSHLNKVGIEGRTPMEEYALAAKELNILNFYGMEDEETSEKLLSLNKDSVRIIKPFADHEVILSQMKSAEEQGAIALGIDIDHVYGKDGKYDIVDGLPMGPVTLEDIKCYVNATKLPFVLKGVLSVSDAIKAKEAGVNCIVISTHHGRIPYGVPPLMLLPKIRETVGERMTIILDGQVFSGYDVFKALALGADAVMVGRGILPELLKEGKEGVSKKISQMNAELSEIMGYTGSKNPSSIDSSLLYLPKGY